MSGKKSTFQIRQNYPAPVGFLPEPDFCWIWKKCRIPAAAEAEIQYIPTTIYRPVAECHTTCVILKRCYRGLCDNDDYEYIFHVLNTCT